MAVNFLSGSDTHRILRAQRIVTSLGAVGVALALAPLSAYGLPADSEDALATPAASPNIIGTLPQDSETTGIVDDEVGTIGRSDAQPDERKDSSGDIREPDATGGDESSGKDTAIVDSNKSSHANAPDKTDDDVSSEDSGLKSDNIQTVDSSDSIGADKSTTADDVNATSGDESPQGETTVSEVTEVPLYRLYNPNTGEHLYTVSTNERDVLSRIGWIYEGQAWISPSLSNLPVFRLYNPNNGDHHYTISENEYSVLGTIGWVREGRCWYADDNSGIPLFRFFNPNANVGTHHYTSSAEERMRMVSDGWVYEGIAWYGTDDGPRQPNIAGTGWISSDGAIFYGDETGEYVRGWQLIDGNTYYFDNKGRKVTGATDVNGDLYDFGDDGRLRHGWRDHSGYRYYFDTISGKLSTVGWMSLNNDWYYLSKVSGAMARGLQRIDGLLRFFSDDGICDKVGYQVNWNGLRLSVSTVSLPSYTWGSFWSYVTPSIIAVDASRDACIEAFISTAYQYMDARTRWVDNHCSRPGDTVDCSGLVMECLYACGMSLDGTSAGDFNPYSKYYWNHSFANTWRNNQIFQLIPLSSIERGDIIYYSGHVAIYLGGGQIIESTSLASNVRVGSMYNSGRPLGAARPFTK